MPRHRELCPALDGTPAGRASADAARLPASRRLDDRRREPSNGSADQRDVPRGPLAEGSARSVWIPSSLGARQPSPEFRGMGSTRRAADVRVGHTGSLRTAACRRCCRRADHPAHRAPGSGHRGAAGSRTGRRSSRGDPRPGGPARASARDDPHQAHGRRPDPGTTRSSG